MIMEQILTDANNEVDASSPPTTASPAAITACRRPGRPGPGQRPGRHRGRHPEHPARDADDDRLQADQAEAAVAAAVALALRAGEDIDRASTRSDFTIIGIKAEDGHGRPADGDGLVRTSPSSRSP